MEEENSDVAEEVTAEEDNLAIDDEWEARAGEPNRGPETENGEDLEGLREFEPEEGHEDEDGVVEELERRESPAPENREERPESMEETGERSHWNGVVFERRQNQRVSRISAAVDRRIPAKIVNEINAMAREWSAGIGPSGNGRRWRNNRRRNRWSTREIPTYAAMEVNTKDQVFPHDWLWLHRNPTIDGCSDR
nr:hypothetical protein CTI12_AA382470 [Ipomoea batatas]